MGKRCKFYLTFFLCVAIVGNSACSTTTYRIGPSAAAMKHYGVGRGDVVLVRYANSNDARSSRRSEQVRITGVNHSGISGIGENGEAVNAGYDEIFEIEYIKGGLFENDDPDAMGKGKTLEVMSKILFVTAYIFGASAGGYSSPGE